MFRFAIPAIAALGLVAAAAQSSAGNSEAPAAADGMGWSLTHEGPMAKLAYGVANSDQLALMLTCEPGQSQAAVYGDVRPAGPQLIRASAGPVAIDPLGGGLLDEARISTRAPAVRRLVRTGILAVEGDAGRFELTATRTERRMIGEFIAWCGADQA
jgi:hypothetical protein